MIVMKTLVIYYSYTGKTKQIANDIAKKEEADLIEVKDSKPHSKASTYIAGSFKAMRKKEAKLQEYECDFSSYDKIIIAMPLWAGFPAPPMNYIIKSLPKGKEVVAIITSGSGSSSTSAEDTKRRITDKGCKVVKYLDIKT